MKFMNAEVGKKAGMVLVNIFTVGALNIVGNQINQKSREISNDIGKGATRSVHDKWMEAKRKRNR